MLYVGLAGCLVGGAVVGVAFFFFRVDVVGVPVSVVVVGVALGVAIFLFTISIAACLATSEVYVI